MCSFREIVNRLKVMAQLLRPPPKRRPSQIASQASVGSASIPSQPALNSQPSSAQNANIADLPAVAEIAARGSILSPRGPSDRPPLGSPAKAPESSPAEQQEAAEPQHAEQATDSKTEEASSQPSETAPKQRLQDTVESDTKSKASEEYVSPFEQAQEPSALQPKSPPQSQ